MKDLKGIYTIWLRDLKRYWRDKARLVGSLAQPTLFLFILGTGLGAGLSRMTAARGGGEVEFAPGMNAITFIYPGIIGMTLLFVSIFSAVSIIWDREFGFLKEVLVAPISRTAVALGKALGGSTVAMIQGTIMLIFAPLVGVSLTLPLIIKLWLMMFILSFSLTSLGMVFAVRMRSMEGFQMIMNFLLMPMFLLSGALFPIRNLPEWLNFFVKINPLTYGVDALRGMITGYSEYSLLFSFFLIFSFGLATISLAVYLFRVTE